jgi:hypothetical protein
MTMEAPIPAPLGRAELPQIVGPPAREANRPAGPPAGRTEDFPTLNLQNTSDHNHGGFGTGRLMLMLTRLVSIVP